MEHKALAQPRRNAFMGKCPAPIGITEANPLNLPKPSSGTSARYRPHATPAGIPCTIAHGPDAFSALETVLAFLKLLPPPLASQPPHKMSRAVRRIAGRLS